MIEIECDACEKVFEVELDDAGSKVDCPHCGDVNRVPQATGRPAASATSRGAAADQGEREIHVVRPGMFRAHPFRYGVIVLLFVGGVTLAIMANVGQTLGSWLMWPGFIIAALGLAWFVSWWATTHWWMKLVVTNKRSIRHEGVIRRHTTEVLHDHVRSVDINQNFLQRILSVGTIGIDSAGQDGIEIEMDDIPRPYEVKKIIDKYRKM